MSTKERRRLAVLDQVKAGDLSLQAAAEVLELSYRQMLRVYQRFQAEGDAGLVHGLRGRPGNRQGDPGLREQAVALYGEHYSDFGCVLACEMLSARHGLAVDDQTLRRWLTAAGLWKRRRKSPVRRRRRERKACFGELVQIDGSAHDWFEGRRAPCVLMVMIDDATGWTLAWFVEAETTQAAMAIFLRWALRHGLPGRLYPDQHGIYQVNTKAAQEQALRTGTRPLTQFGRAMEALGVKVTCAKSPQAKGRVERMNGTLQDRLIKALRLAGISDLASANAFLEQTFLPELNARFRVAPASEADVHVAVSEAELHQALCVKETRTVGQDHCLSWQGQVLQLKAERGVPSLAGKRVEVCEGLDDRVEVRWKERVIEHEAVAARPREASVKGSLAERVAGQAGPSKPAADHPWRRGPITRDAG